MVTTFTPPCSGRPYTGTAAAAAAEPLSMIGGRGTTFPSGSADDAPSPSLSSTNCDVPSSSSSHPVGVATSAATRKCCIICNYDGADLHIKGEGRSNSPSMAGYYHARCVDLFAVRNLILSSTAAGAADDDTSNNIRLEIVPLDTTLLDQANLHPQPPHAVVTESAVAANHNNKGEALGDSAILSTSPIISHPNISSSLQQQQQRIWSSAAESSIHNDQHDPNTPRTGRWTDEELAYRDAVIHHFTNGSLPLCNGLRLTDFLCGILNSRPSRLTKKLKHAKLSTNLYRIQTGHLSSSIGSGAQHHGGSNISEDNNSNNGNISEATQFSKLEYNFIHAITNPTERRQIILHMQREWRENLFQRLTYLRLIVDATSWLTSIDTLDRQVALDGARVRANKRRCLMGRALRLDVHDSTPGVFINHMQKEDIMMEYNTTANSNNIVVVVPPLQQQIGGVGGLPNTNKMSGGGSDGHNNSIRNIKIGTADAGAASTTNNYNKDSIMDDDGEFDEFLIGMLENPACDTPASFTTTPLTTPSIPPLSIGGGGGDDSLASVWHGQLTDSPTGGLYSTASTSRFNDLNFRRASPFLASVMSYMERSNVPFEHIDVWVPSSAPSSTTTTQQHHESNSNTSVRLCFGGSATLGTQIITSQMDTNEIETVRKRMRDTSLLPEKAQASVVPLTNDEAFSLFMFGDYSEKFSFNSGCGLPGRVYQSGVATWEQFLPNAPPEMFERRGGAIQFGINTALGLPINSPTVGRIVLVLYSRHDREKDERLVARMIKDMLSFNPSPRWRLVVDDKPTNSPPLMGPSVAVIPPSLRHSMHTHTEYSTTLLQPPALLGGNPALCGRITSLLNVLNENMPSNLSSILNPQVKSIQSLRLLLLSKTRTKEEEELVETLLILYESYSTTRTSHDIALLIARDYDFHIQHMNIHRPITAIPSSLTLSSSPSSLSTTQQQSRSSQQPMPGPPYQVIRMPCSGPHYNPPPSSSCPK